MSTTVRIRGEDKERLRRLQEAWRRVRGEAPSQQDLLARGLEYLERHQEAFLSDAAWRPLSPSEVERLRARQGSYGAWSGADVDAEVYDEV